MGRSRSCLAKVHARGYETTTQMLGSRFEVQKRITILFYTRQEGETQHTGLRKKRAYGPRRWPEEELAKKLRAEAEASPGSREGSTP